MFSYILHQLLCYLSELQNKRAEVTLLLNSVRYGKVLQYIDNKTYKGKFQMPWFFLSFNDHMTGTTTYCIVYIVYICNSLIFGKKIAVVYSVYHVPKVSLMKWCKKCGCIVLFSVITILYLYFAAWFSVIFRLCTVCSNVSSDS